jgi:uncharacterized tellurite resistance protein B-like protein
MYQEAGEMMEIDDKLQICKVVAQAILSDGQITDSEHAFIQKLMEKYALSPEQKKEVLARNIDDDVGSMAAEVSVFDSQNELLTELALAVVVDGKIAPAEKDLLKRVAAAMNMAEADLDLLINAAIS